MDLQDCFLERKSRFRSVGMVCINIFLTLLIAALIAVMIVTSTFSLCQVDGESMMPTLSHEQYVLVEKNKSASSRGDTVIFAKDGKQYIKRVVALSGDTFKFARTDETAVINNNLTSNRDQTQYVVVLYVNGERVAEPYLGEPMCDGLWRVANMKYSLGQEYTVSEGCVLALGDNRNISSDSRSIGEVTPDEFVGKVGVIVEKSSVLEVLVKWIYGVNFRTQTA